MRSARSVSYTHLDVYKRQEDYNLRKTLKKQLYSAGVPKIEIERDASKVRIHIHCAKPGMVIGKGGSEIEKLRLQCEKMLNKPCLLYTSRCV